MLGGRNTSFMALRRLDRIVHAHSIAHMCRESSPKKTNYNRYLKVSKARKIVNKTGTDVSLEISPFTPTDSSSALDSSSLVSTMTDVSQITTTIIVQPEEERSLPHSFGGSDSLVTDINDFNISKLSGQYFLVEGELCDYLINNFRKELSPFSFTLLNFSVFRPIYSEN